MKGISVWQYRVGGTVLPDPLFLDSTLGVYLLQCQLSFNCMQLCALLRPASKSSFASREWLYSVEVDGCLSPVCILHPSKSAHLAKSMFKKQSGQAGSRYRNENAIGRDATVTVRYAESCLKHAKPVWFCALWVIQMYMPPEHQRYTSMLASLAPRLENVPQHT
jgi:hypothetical protein